MTKGKAHPLFVAIHGGDLEHVQKEVENFLTSLSYSNAGDKEKVISHDTDVKDHDHDQQDSDKRPILSLEDIKDEKDRRLLHVACLVGNVDIVRYLWNKHQELRMARRKYSGKKKGLIFLEDGDNRTTLHFACQGGNLDVVQFIISSEGSKRILDTLLEKKDSEERTPLFYACGSEEDSKKDATNTDVDDDDDDDKVKRKEKDGPLVSTELVEFLLENGAKFDGSDDDGRTPLYYACRSGCIDVVRLLLRYGKKRGKISPIIDKVDVSNRFPLQIACEDVKSLEIVDVLLEYGADINKKIDSGGTILFSACRGGNLDIVKRIQDTMNEHDIDIRNEHEQTLLHAACEGGNLAVVHFLVENMKAKIDARDVNNKTTLHSACHGGNLDIVKLLLEMGDFPIDVEDDSDKTPLLYACEGGHLDVVKFLLDNGANVKAYDVNKTTALYLSSGWNKPLLVKLLLEHGANPNLARKDKLLPLHKACGKKNNAAVVDLLSGKTKKINSRGGWSKESPLFCACKNGASLAVVKTLTSKGADPSVSDKYNRNALHIACASNAKEEVVEAILSAIIAITTSGDNDNENAPAIGIGDSGKKTALHYACQNSPIGVVKLLLDRGASAIVKDKDGFTAMDYACKRGDVEVVKLLTTRGIEATSEDLKNALDNDQDDVAQFLIGKGVAVRRLDGMTTHPLQRAAKEGNLAFAKLLVETHDVALDVTGPRETTRPFHIAAREGQADIVEYFLQQGADIEQKDFDDETALHLACKGSHFGVVKLLLEKGADIEAEGADEETPLHYACQQEEEDICQLILSKNPTDINKRNSDGKTPIHYAAEHGNVAMVTMLMEKGGQYNAVDDDKNTPLHHACSGEKLDNAIALVKGGASIHSAGESNDTPLHLACNGSNVELVRFLLAEGANVHSTNDDEETPIHRACYENNYEMVQLLIESDADVNATDDSRQTPLHSAVDNSNRNSHGIAELLIKNGAKSEQVDEDKETAFHLAARNGDKETLKLLLGTGIDINAENHRNRTPIHIASASMNIEAVEFLLANGADVNVVDEDESTPLHFACKEANVQIMQLLFDAGTNARAVNEKNETACHIACEMENMAMLKILLRYDESLLGPTNDDDDDDDPWSGLSDESKNEIIEFAQRENIRILYSHKDILFFLVQNESYDALFRRLVQNKPGIVRYRDDETHRTLLEMACDACRRATLFFDRYKLNVSLRYESETCQVYLAEDWGDTHKKEVDKINERPVVLKFFKHKQQYDSERNARRTEDDTERFDREYVIADLRWYDGDVDVPFAEECKAWDKPMYCVVLEQAGRNLYETMGAENFIDDVNRTRDVLSDLAQSIHHMHRGGYIHGDIKPRNVVRQLDDRRWQLIDLDACTCIGDPVGNKLSTAYVPPELLKVMSGKPFLRASSNSMAKESGDVLTAQTSYDVWAFGLVMYELATGISFFRSNVRDNLEGNMDLMKLARWRDIDTRKQLENVSDNVTRNLLQKLLRVDPSQRLSMEEVLDDDFFHPERMEELQHQLTHLKEKLDIAESENNEEEVIQLVGAIQDMKFQINLHEGRDSIGDMKQEVIESRELIDQRLDEISDSLSRLEKVNQVTNRLLTNMLQGDDIVPRYFCIVPIETSTWHNPKHWIHQRVKVIFLCPISYRIMSDFGYEMELPINWIKRYGPALVTSLQCIRIALAAGKVATGVPIPGIDNFGTWFSNLCTAFLDENDNDEDANENDEYELEGVLNGLTKTIDSIMEKAEDDVSVVVDGKMDESKWLTTVKRSYLNLIRKKLARNHKYHDDGNGTNNNDDDVGSYKQTGLVKAIGPDGTVEFVHPEYKLVYETRGMTCYELSQVTLERERHQLQLDRSEEDAAREWKLHQRMQSRKRLEEQKRRRRQEAGGGGEEDDEDDYYHDEDYYDIDDEEEDGDDGEDEDDRSHMTDDDCIFQTMVEKRSRHFPYTWSKHIMRLQWDGTLYYVKCIDGQTTATTQHHQYQRDPRDGKAIRIVDIQKKKPRENVVYFVSSNNQMSFYARPVLDVNSSNNSKNSNNNNHDTSVDTWIELWRRR